MSEEFSNYQEFLAYVNESWESGEINELECEEFIKVAKETSDPETGRVTRYTYRPLTAGEFLQRQASDARFAALSRPELLARYEARALSFVNRLRASANCAPLLKLEAGETDSPTLCPLALSLSDFGEDFRGDGEPDSNVIDIEVDGQGAAVYCNSSLVEKFPLNRDTRNFVKCFDRYQYPHLIAERLSNAIGDEIPF